MYEHSEIDADVIAREYFESQNGINQWFKDSSYGKVALKGTIVGWIQIDKEYTAEEMYADSDYLVS
jgi:hypothetical protein